MALRAHNLSAPEAPSVVLPHVILLPDASPGMLPPSVLLSSAFGFLSRKAEGQSDAAGGRRIGAWLGDHAQAA